MQSCCRQSLGQLGTVRAASALNLGVLSDDVPIAAVEITNDGLALRFEAKPGSALLVRARPEP
jgi:hypothetical protein